MKVTLPVFSERDIPGWARRLLVTLDQAFDLIKPELDAGVYVLWEDGIAPPQGWLVADGTAYPSQVYPRLAKKYGESSPGEITLPDLSSEAPEGFLYLVKA